MKTEKILVALAFSPTSENLLTAAVELARPLEAELLLVNVIDRRDVDAVCRVADMGYQVDAEHYVREMEKERLALVEEMLTRVDFPQDRLQLIFKVGHPAEVLLEMAAKKQVDMIIMGKKAHSGLEHALAGSVAGQLFHRSPIPLLSCPL